MNGLERLARVLASHDWDLRRPTPEKDEYVSQEWERFQSFARISIEILSQLSHQELRDLAASPKVEMIRMNDIARSYTAERQ